MAKSYLHISIRDHLNFRILSHSLVSEFSPDFSPRLAEQGAFLRSCVPKFFCSVRSCVALPKFESGGAQERRIEERVQFCRFDRGRFLEHDGKVLNSF